MLLPVLERGWNALWAAIAIIGAAAVVSVLALNGSSPSSTRTESTQQAATRPPAPTFPTLVRGGGTEETRGTGIYNRTPLAVRGALALNVGEGMVWVELYPEPVSCASWNVGSPGGLFVLAAISVTPDTLARLPTDRPLNNYSVYWVQNRGVHSTLDGIDGTMTLTVIDTNPGGFWRGRIDSSGSSANNKPQSLRSTFAAEWCNDVTLGLNGQVDMKLVQRLQGVANSVGGTLGGP